MKIKSADGMMKTVEDQKTTQDAISNSGQPGEKSGKLASVGASTDFSPLPGIRKERGVGGIVAAILLFLLLAIPASLAAQAPLIQVDAAVDKAQITIGDRITYTLQVERDTSLIVKDPGKGTNLGMFEIKDYKVYPPKKSGARLTEKFEYTISVYDTGRFVIPPFPLAFRTPDSSSEFQIITSEPLEIYVQSLIKAEDADIREIRPPRVPDGGWVWWQIALAGLIIALIVAAAIWWWLRKSRNGEPIFRKEVIRPAHEIALEALQKLTESDLLSAGRTKAFYTELSDILRRYLEGRFYIRAMEETTAEIVDSLAEVDLAAEVVQEVESVLSACDLVKFAKYIPGEGETEEAVTQLRDLIEKTKLEFEAVEHREMVNGKPDGDVFAGGPDSGGKVQGGEK